MKEIKIKLNKLTGDVTAETSGFQGSECTEATKPLLDALGGAEDQTLKDEYHEIGGLHKVKQKQ